MIVNLNIPYAQRTHSPSDDDDKRPTAQQADIAERTRARVRMKQREQENKPNEVVEVIPQVIPRDVSPSHEAAILKIAFMACGITNSYPTSFYGKIY